MEKFTDPVTSDSELEEGEIANDDIEIISEIIRHPPNKKMQPRLKESIHGKNSLVARKGEIPKVVDSRLQKQKLSVSTSSSGGRGGKIETNRTSDQKPAPRNAVGEKSSVPVKRKSPARNLKRLGQHRSSPKAEISRSSRFRANSRSNRERGSSMQSKKEDKSYNSLAVAPGASKDAKWKQSFELVTPGSVESMDTDSDPETDEEIKLRLEALHSVVNAKPKDVPISDVMSSQTCSTPDSLIPNGMQEEEEDEDEELLRAQLLIEVARKQTKELEVQMQPEPKDMKAGEVVPPVFERRNQATKTVSKPIHIPKAERLVIDLRNDSSDSSDDEDDRVEVSITALLKTARQTVEEKVSVIPNALSHLPRNQQEEYQRLKQEILRRENRLMKQGTTKMSTLIQSQSDNLPKSDDHPENCIDKLVLSEPSLVSSIADKFNIVVPTQIDSVPSPDLCVASNSSLDPDMSQKSSPVIPPQPVCHESNAKENQATNEQDRTSNEDAVPKLQSTSLNPHVPDGLKTTRSPNKATDSPKLSALKQQLLHKKRDLALTKEALKSQLGLVDKNRLLWMKSSQEVSRLKTMLLAAEETERQLRTQFTNSQQQTQRLKTKMQTVERQVTLLHNGIGVHRTRRISTKLRPKIVSPQTVSSATTTVVNLPTATPLRVKPRVFAKALAKTNQHLTYRRPIVTTNELAMPSAGESIHLPKKTSFSEVSGEKKALHDEQWLYGTLGDDWSSTNVASDFPSWSPHGHASRFL